MSPLEPKSGWSEDEGDEEDDEEAPLENPDEEEPEWLEWLDEEEFNNIIDEPPPSTSLSEEEEEDRRVEEGLLDRLILTGLLSRRRGPSDFLESLKNDFLDLAAGLPFLDSITLDVSIRGKETGRRLDWSVVRLPTRIVLFGNPLPKSASFNLEDPFCICHWISEDTTELRNYLERLPPLFSQLPNFTPKFTLDRFVVRQ